MSQIVIAHPKTVYSVVLALVILSLAMLPKIEIDTDPENMLSSDTPARVTHARVKKDFNMHDMIFVGVVSKNSVYEPKTLSVLHKLTEQTLQIDGVITQELMSLAVVDNIRQEANGGIRFEYLMKLAPETQEASDEIQQAVSRLPMLQNTLVSGDGKALGLYVPITSKDLSYEIAEKIRALTPKDNPDLSFHITGLPVAEDQFGFEMFVQMGIAAPLAGLMIFILLWFFFRNIQLIMAPMIVAMATVFITMGTLIGMGFTVHIMSSMIAIFLMPIAVVDSVHILSEFADEYKDGDKPDEVVANVVSKLFKPMLFTSLTSSAGFFSLMLTPIPPVKVFGAFVGSGILLAFVLTIVFLPVYLSRLSQKNLTHLHDSMERMRKTNRLSRFLVASGKFATARTKSILVVALVVLVISIEGITRIEINDNPVNWFKPDHEIRIADKVLNHHFAGSYDAWLTLRPVSKQADSAESRFKQLVQDAKNDGHEFSSLGQYIAKVESGEKDQLLSSELLTLLDDLVFDASGDSMPWLEKLYQHVESHLADGRVFLDPQMLNWIADLQEKLIATGWVGKVNSLTDIVKTVNRELVSGDAKDFRVPDSPEAVSQTLLQYQSSHRPQDLWHFVSKDYQESLLWLQLTSGDNQHVSKMVDWTNQYIADNPPPRDMIADWAGKSYLNVVWQDAMVKGMLDSLTSSFVIVFFMMVALFRSIKYGVLAMLPLTFTISMIYGLIGWFGKAYDMPIAVLSALSLGLSIDFAIHFLQRTRELEQELGSLSTALVAMFEEPARAISRNAIVIAIGFTPLLLSPLVPYITVGFFLASIMAVSAIVTLLLLPAALTNFSRAPKG